MLVLARKKNQRIMIGDDIVVTVTRIEQGKVYLGIDAPKGVQVHREEVYEQIQKERASANDNKAGGEEFTEN